MSLFKKTEIIELIEISHLKKILRTYSKFNDKYNVITADDSELLTVIPFKETLNLEETLNAIDRIMDGAVWDSVRINFKKNRITREQYANVTLYVKIDDILYGSNRSLKIKNIKYSS